MCQKQKQKQKKNQGDSIPIPKKISAWNKIPSSYREILNDVIEQVLISLIICCIYLLNPYRYYL